MGGELMADKRKAHRPSKPRNVREREDELDAFAALARMRREGLTASQAAEVEGTTIANLEKYVGPALNKRGRDYVAKPSDDLLRPPLLHVDSKGLQWIDVRGSKTAKLISRYWRAFDEALKGKPKDLKKFENESIPGTKHKFLTDLKTIRQLQDAGVLEGIKEIYWHGRRR
jgi:hypothetical protein